MADTLKLEDKTARKVVRHVFQADGDIFQHVSRLSEWSGLSGDEFAEEYEGE